MKNESKQEDMIREMALQQKKKKQEESSACHLSWNCKTATSTTGGIWTFLSYSIFQIFWNIVCTENMQVMLQSGQAMF